MCHSRAKRGIPGPSELPLPSWRRGQDGRPHREGDYVGLALVVIVGALWVTGRCSKELCIPSVHVIGGIRNFHLIGMLKPEERADLRTVRSLSGILIFDEGKKMEITCSGPKGFQFLFPRTFEPSPSPNRATGTYRDATGSLSLVRRKLRGFFTVGNDQRSRVFNYPSNCATAIGERVIHAEWWCNRVRGNFDTNVWPLGYFESGISGTKATAHVVRLNSHSDQLSKSTEDQSASKIDYPPVRRRFISVIVTLLLAWIGCGHGLDEIHAGRRTRGWTWLIASLLPFAMSLILWWVNFFAWT